MSDNNFHLWVKAASIELKFLKHGAALAHVVAALEALDMERRGIRVGTMHPSKNVDDVNQPIYEPDDWLIDTKKQSARPLYSIRHWGLH
jgi:hypothetical protein